MLPAWLKAWLRPLSALKPFCLAMPSVMPVTAGTIAALASDCAICENVTAQKFCEIRMIAEASTTQMPGITTHMRLLRLASMKPPIGVVISMPATLPIVIAVPINPLAQPRSWRKTPTKGPMPDCMSAMKKLRANRGQIRDEEGDRDVIDTKTSSQPEYGGWDIILSANRSGADEALTSADRVGSSPCPEAGLAVTASNSLLTLDCLCWEYGMPLWTCETCGAQFPDGENPPAACQICEDERQYVGWKGQTFLTREALSERHCLAWRDDLGLTGIALEPSFAIGQRALLVPLADGWLMWDCVPLATPEAIAHMRSLGGLKAIAISHPHYYGALADWSEAFGGVPVYLHADDRQWVTRPHASIVHWTGENHRISDDVLLLRTGGHFAGATMLHHARGADGRGALLTGDIAQVTMDRRFVSFMYSYPNYMPLNAAAVRRIAAAVEPLAFDRIYGAWWDRNIAAGAKAAFAASVARYLAAIA
ncbi:glyoxylase-like metal-dependent hydrolase (beta-lactamase superfamily II) [Bradyrhizobium sp. GM6.1]